MKLYRVKITEIDGDSKKEVYKEDMQSVVMLGRCEEDSKCAEVVINENIPGIAALIKGSTKVVTAAKLMALGDLMMEQIATEAEDKLNDSIGGVQ